MLRILPSLSYPTISSSHHPSSHHPSQPKTPPSTPLLEKGPRSTSKRSKPGLYYTHEIRAYKRYTRCLHVVIVLLLVALVVGWFGGGRGNCRGGGEGEGGLGVMRGWMGGTTVEKGKEKGVDDTAIARTMAHGDGDNVVLAIQHCGIILEESEEGCLRRFGGVATSSRGKREAWREMKDGLEGLWRGLIESECKCRNPEVLDRMYEGLRERAGEMVGGSGGVGEVEVLEG